MDIRVDEGQSIVFHACPSRLDENSQRCTVLRYTVFLTASVHYRPCGVDAISQKPVSIYDSSAPRPQATDSTAVTYFGSMHKDLHKLLNSTRRLLAGVLLHQRCTHNLISHGKNNLDRRTTHHIPSPQQRSNPQKYNYQSKSYTYSAPSADSSSAPRPNVLLSARTPEGKAGG